MRQRSKFVVTEDLPVLCSNCCAPGHNKQTCTTTPVCSNCCSTGHNNKNCCHPAQEKQDMNCCQWYQRTLEASDPRKNSTHWKWKEFDYNILMNLYRKFKIHGLNQPQLISKTWVLGVWCCVMHSFLAALRHPSNMLSPCEKLF
jgi:hypothetical protein